jgi:hypothetical protein
MRAGFRFGSCDSAKGTSGNHRLLLERVKAAEACACGAVGPKVTFHVLSKRKEGRTIVIHGYWVIECKVLSLKTGETHDPFRYGLIESFKPWAESLVGTLRLLVPTSYLVVFVLVSSQKMSIFRSRALDQTD